LLKERSLGKQSRASAFAGATLIDHSGSMELHHARFDPVHTTSSPTISYVAITASNGVSVYQQDNKLVPGPTWLGVGGRGLVHLFSRWVKITMSSLVAMQCDLQRPNSADRNAYSYNFIFYKKLT